MITLYHAPQSRSSRIIWLLEELGEPYAIEYVSIRRNDGTGGPDSRNPHPDKKVPALLHDDRLVTESAAICLHLTDAFPDAKLGPEVGDPSRTDYLTWLFYYAGVVEPVLVAKLTGRTERDPEDKRAYDQMSVRLREALRRGPYLVGEEFSAADILLESAFVWGRVHMPQGPEVDAYLARLSTRPARSRAFSKDSAPGS